MTKKINIKCRFCGSNNVIKHGKRFGKTKITQRYWCKSCDRKFSLGNKYHFNFDIIEDALIYLLNHSLRETAEYINKTYGVEVAHETIHNWKKSFLKKGTVLGKELNPKVKQTFTLVQMLRQRESRLIKRFIEFEERLDSVERKYDRLVNKIVNYWKELKNFKEVD